MNKTIKGKCFSSLGKRKTNEAGGKESDLSFTLIAGGPPDKKELAANVWISDKEGRNFAFCLNDEFLRKLYEEMSDFKAKKEF